MSEEQLERSILERKASDELRAIATAMSLEPVARTRKADLVNQILRAAGVEVDGDSPASTSWRSGRRPRRRVNGGDRRASRGTTTGATAASASKPARGRTSRARSSPRPTRRRPRPR